MKEDITADGGGIETPMCRRNCEKINKDAPVCIKCGVLYPVLTLIGVGSYRRADTGHGKQSPWESVS